MGAAGRGGCVWPRSATAATAFAAARTSLSVTRPSGPVPFTLRKVDAELSRDPSRHWRCFHPRFRFLCGGSGRSARLLSRDSDAGARLAASLSCGGAVSFSSALADAGFSVSACSSFGSSGFFASFSGSSSFFSSVSQALSSLPWARLRLPRR